VHEERCDEAFYRPPTDTITLPLREQFTAMDGFVRTALHEMCHSTAREVGRDMDRSPEGYAREELANVPTLTYEESGSPEGYAREELVAELESVFAAADAGLDIKAFASTDMGRTYLENHAAYLQSWLAAIKDDPSALAKAATAATKAADYVVDRREKVALQASDHKRIAEKRSDLDRRGLVSRANNARDISKRAMRQLKTDERDSAIRSICRRYCQ
jgi:antirestriction protein ArdC